jgi:hypothetical protein
MYHLILVFKGKEIMETPTPFPSSVTYVRVSYGRERQMFFNDQQAQRRNQRQERRRQEERRGDTGGQTRQKTKTQGLGTGEERSTVLAATCISFLLRVAIGIGYTDILLLISGQYLFSAFAFCSHIL